jgi:adenosylcobinamide kinase / adenosylcobinamide-phosphate guanylyltransferase
MALVVFTGGARSGKSAAAQELARRRAIDGEHVAALVFALVGDDAEMAERVARHQAGRPDAFDVIEVSDSRAFLRDVDSRSLLLIDCLGTLVGMVMAEEWPVAEAGHGLVDAAGELPSGYDEAVETRVAAIVEALCAWPGDSIVVTNEVGNGVVPDHASGRLFRDVLGRANRRLVAGADGAYLTVCGRLVDLTALTTSPGWPED